MKTTKKDWTRYQSMENSAVDIFVKNAFGVQQISVYSYNSSRLELCVNLELDKISDMSWFLKELDYINSVYGIRHFWVGNAGENYYKIAKYASENNARWANVLSNKIVG